MGRHEDKGGAREAFFENVIMSALRATGIEIKEADMSEDAVGCAGIESGSRANARSAGSVTA
jgi:hypothetical protein